MHKISAITHLKEDILNSVGRVLIITNNINVSKNLFKELKSEYSKYSEKDLKLYSCDSEVMFHSLDTESNYLNGIYVNSVIWNVTDYISLDFYNKINSRIRLY